MIPAQRIVDRMNAALDAEDSDRYIFEKDHRPAINDAVTWMTTLFSSALEARKISSENLRELIRIRVWQSSIHGRVRMNPSEMGHEPFFVIGVYPDASVTPDKPWSHPLDKNKSKLRGDLTFLKSDYSAGSLSYEQWMQNRKNIFKKGNETLEGEWQTYAYLNYGNYGSTSYDQGKEIDIRPAPWEKFVGIAYIKRPALIENISDDIELPEAVENMVYQRALNFVSFKQGDQTNLYSVTQNDIQQLVGILR